MFITQSWYLSSELWSEDVKVLTPNSAWLVYQTLWIYAYWKECFLYISSSKSSHKCRSCSGFWHSRRLLSSQSFLNRHLCQRKLVFLRGQNFVRMLRDAKQYFDSHLYTKEGMDVESGFSKLRSIYQTKLSSRNCRFNSHCFLFWMSLA